ncbi:MAG TPA: hypothetical protein VEZ40_19825 [Pyrinomonadaceae bacterium]|nr:hypothetical protein [Pyrinomonadaceae bacterium]
MNGYVSFKIGRPLIAASTRLTVAHGASRDGRVFKIADLLTGGDTHTIRIDSTAFLPVSAQPGLPSVIDPDAGDVNISPGSIGQIPQLGQGRGLCGQLMPTVMGVRRFPAFQIGANICRHRKLLCGNEPVVIVEGEMLEYEIAWHPAGTALGDLLNTITLAPCEQVNIAIVDWMRRETTTLDETSDVRQQSYQQIDHDRLIVETMQSSTQKMSRAWSIAGAVGVKKKVPNKLDLTASLGGGFSSTKSSSQIAASTSSQLSAHITQSASFVASQRNTVVFQTTASEHQTFQTRTIRNHNHCRTATFVYYQVNRNYKVVTEYKGKRPVILVKYDNKEFDAARAYCHAELLKEALLDQSLVGCFDELADALFCCDIKPPAPPPPPPSGEKALMDSLRLTVDVGNIQGSVTLVSVGLYSATTQGLSLANIGSTNTNAPPLWVSGGLHTLIFPVNPPIDPQLVDSMSIAVHGPSSVLTWQPVPVVTPLPPPTAGVDKIDADYHVAGQNRWFSLCSLQNPTTIGANWRTPVEPELPSQQQPTPTPASPVKNECVENSCCIQKLLGHLNCHKRYYNTLLWLDEDPNDRVMKWSCCDDGDLPFNLIEHIENEPITVYGDYLVFPVAGSELVDDPAILPIEKLVTMPTPGVYAEGILGQCNTCEKIDPDTFWNWKDSPCPDTAPALTNPPKPQQGVSPSDFKTDAISNLISFSNVPSVPDSVLKDLISALVASADGGSSEAKGLLDKLLDTIKESLKPPS